VRSLHGRRPRTRRRARAAGRGAAAVVLAVLPLALAACSAHPGTAAASSPAPAVSPRAASASPSTAAPNGGGSTRPAAASPDTAQDRPGSCAGTPLKSQLAAAAHGGASLIVAVGTLTGKSMTGDQVTGDQVTGNQVTGNQVTGNQATAGAPAFYAMTLTSVQTLRGPAVASGSTAWIPGPAPGATATPENSALLAPGGRLFAIAWPRAATHDPVGPWLRLAPVVGADVVFTPYGCWNLTGLAPDQYQASTPLRPVPGGANFGGTHQAAENGLYTLPLATVEQLAASA
jgi:hypothetical protein